MCHRRGYNGFQGYGNTVSREQGEGQGREQWGRVGSREREQGEGVGRGSRERE